MTAVPLGLGKTNLQDYLVGMKQWADVVTKDVSSAPEDVVIRESTELLPALLLEQKLYTSSLEIKKKKKSIKAMVVDGDLNPCVSVAVCAGISSLPFSTGVPDSLLFLPWVTFLYLGRPSYISPFLI